MNIYKIDKNEIGEYLLKLIAENEKYKNQRKFCQAYLSFAGLEVNDEETRKMANRLSQIIKGKKSIQVTDLPIFTKLLDVSCEEILSAGKFFTPQVDRLTNYSVAFSDDKEVWETYINHPDELILNMDEHGKTVLDYAFEYKNSKFINYLIDKGYIWFDKTGGFSANSDIKSDFNGRWNDPHNCYLKLQLNDIAFREKLIGLAVSENNIELLNQMHAREISQFKFLSTKLTIPEYTSKIYVEEINRNIVKTNAEVINYFTEEFEIIQYESKKFILMYPFISGLLDLLIKQSSKFAENALKKAISHNQKTYSGLKSIIKKAIEEEFERINQLKEEYFLQEKPRSLKFVLDGLTFNETYYIINFIDHYSREEMTTNIAKVTETSKDDKINELITELNEIYSKVTNIREEFQNGNI